MTQIGRKSFPYFRIYTDTTESKIYEIDDNVYKSYKVNYQCGHDSIYEIEPCLIPDGFIEDMALWGAKDVEVIVEDRVLEDDGNVYNRTITYNCAGDKPKIKILESCNSQIDKGYANLKIILQGRWFRK